jgi:hypothetical protein
MIFSSREPLMVALTARSLASTKPTSRRTSALLVSEPWRVERMRGSPVAATAGVTGGGAPASCMRTTSPGKIQCGLVMSGFCAHRRGQRQGSRK